MSTIWKVVKHDLGVTLRQRSFWVITLILPALVVVMQIVSASGSSSSSTNTSYDPSKTQASTLAKTKLPDIGLVDEAGIITHMPPGIPQNLFTRFPDSPSAQQALQSGQIVQYVLIPQDYMASGKVTVFAKNFSILMNGEEMGVAYGSNNEWILPYLINYNLIGDEVLVAALQNPVPGNYAKPFMLNPPTATESNNRELASLVGTITPYIFYFLLLLSSSYLMRSVVAEKENRTAEVLLLSLPPRQLMFGKILAMTFVLLLQILIYSSVGAILLNRSGNALNLSAYSFPPGFFIWAGLFLVLGYLLFASVMAAAGALAPNAREGAQVTWLLIIPLFPTLMADPIFIENPGNTLAVFLSLFPFSSPSAMVTRLAIEPVPVSQILISLALLAATAYLFVVFAGKFFRADNLLSGKSFNLRRLLTDWRE
jgi:ABC-2 type transport system permease protein